MILEQLVSALRATTIEVVDLTAPLSEDTPVIRLPDDHAQPWPFSREQISRYDAAGPAYWNNFRMSEHTGTHFDAPVHWPSGRELDDIAQIPPGRLVAPAVVLDMSAQAHPDFLLEREHVEAFGPLPDGGWLLYRTGLINGPGVSPDCARWLAEETPIIGLGVETVGTDAAGAAAFDPPFPCHWYLHGANKYGLTQLKNLDRLPARGAVLVTGPLPIEGGSGSPARVLALVERHA